MGTNTARTDIHRPAEMDPADYRFITAFDNEPPSVPTMIDAWRRRSDELHELINTSPLADRGLRQCHHCGARIRYVAVMHHAPSDTYIAVGQQCLGNRFELESKSQFTALRKAAQLDREKQRIKTAAREFIADLDGLAAQLFDRDVDLIELAPDLASHSYAQGVIKDMRHNLWNRYGSLTAKQVEFALRLVNEARERVARDSERATEVKVPAPHGRCTVTGEVIKVDHRHTEWGPVVKLTIKVTTAEGAWRGWVTEPKGITAERGDHVTLTATWTPADDDPSFAFGKRPTVKKANLHSDPNVPCGDANRHANWACDCPKDDL